MNHFIYLLLLLFVSCNICENRTCDCFDEGESAIGIYFNTDSTKSNSFKKTELDSCKIIKWKKENNKLIPIDTQRITIYDYSNKYSQAYNIWNFEALRTTAYASDYFYMIYNVSPAVNIVIGDIKIRGYRSGTCSNCQCYTNESINFSVNGSLYNKWNLPVVINKY